MVVVEEMKLRQPKNDAQKSNHKNVLWSMAEGTSKRDAWKLKATRTGITTVKTSLGECVSVSVCVPPTA
jgi:hypothetical protein